MNFQGGTGFIYYTLENTPKDESSNYLSFSECNTSQDTTFSPSDYSSPQGPYGKSPRQFNNNRRGSRYNNFNNRSRPPNNYRRYQNYSNYSPNKKQQENNYTRYMHPSFTEDPWRHLMKTQGGASQKQGGNSTSETT